MINRKSIVIALIIPSLILMVGFVSFSQSVVIDDDATHTAANAMLQVEAGASNKGFLLPRIAYANKPANAAANDGLLYYFTDGDGTNGAGFYYYEHATTSWEKLGTFNSGWSTIGNTGTTVGTNFLGTTDDEDLAFYSNDTERIRIVGETSGSNEGFVGIGITDPDWNLEIDGALKAGFSVASPDDTACIIGTVVSTGTIGAGKKVYAGDFYSSTSSSSSGTTTGVRARGFSTNASSAGGGYGVDAEAKGMGAWVVGVKGKATNTGDDAVSGAWIRSYGGYFEAYMPNVLIEHPGVDFQRVHGIYAKANESNNKEEVFGGLFETAGGSENYGVYIDNSGNNAAGTSWGSYTSVTGASGTNYGQQISVTSTGTTNYGIFATASGATTNRVACFTTTGTDLVGTVLSNALVTNSGALGGTAGNTLNLASFGATTAAGPSQAAVLGVRARRVVNGANWLSSSIQLSMDVDNTPSAGGYISFYNPTGAAANIGIGIANPAHKLDVFGAVNTTAGLSVDGVNIIGANGADPYVNVRVIQDVSAADGLYINYGSLGGGGGTNHIRFFTGAASVTERMVILSNGNITMAGDLAITGALSKGSGTFKIDHPVDPENKYLYHSFVESPDMMNIYNGNTTTDENGDAVVELPSYFEAFNMDFRYQLTVIGTFAQAIINEEISGNTFKIKTDKPNVKVSWLVTGVRNDPYAAKNRIIPEVEKEEDKKGTYLHPTAYGK